MPPADGTGPGAEADETRAGDGSAARATGAGALLGGRYRLAERVGADLAAGAEFWRGEDRILQRDVALTVLRRLPFGGDEHGPPPAADDADPEGTTRAAEMIVRALRAGGFEHPGCARLLDVLAAGSSGVPQDVLGVAVTEWSAGHSLAEAVQQGLIRPTRAAWMVEQVAAAAEQAHDRGLVLGCDHPQRVRVTTDGRVQVVFALPRLGLRPEDDVSGLTAILYTLLTRQWPLSGSDAAQAGLTPAERDPDGVPVPPSAVRPGVPVELDAVCTASLGARRDESGTGVEPVDAPAPGGALGRVHTAAAVRRMIEEVVAEDERSALFPPEPDGVPTGPGDIWRDRGEKRPVDPERRRKLLVGLGVLGVCVLVVLGYLGVQVGSLFSESRTPAIVVGGDTAAAAPDQGLPRGGQASTVAVGGVSMKVVDFTGDPDNASQVGRVVDGNPATSWSTYTYRQPLPALKPGVGLMASFSSVEQLSRLVVQSPSAGTVVEVRSAPQADSRLDETVLLTRATLGAGRTTIPLTDSQPVQHLLLWITTLGGGGDVNVTQIDEVTFYRAGD